MLPKLIPGPEWLELDLRSCCWDCQSQQPVSSNELKSIDSRYHWNVVFLVKGINSKSVLAFLVFNKWNSKYKTQKYNKVNYQSTKMTFTWNNYCQTRYFLHWQVTKPTKPHHVGTNAINYAFPCSCHLVNKNPV